MTPARHVLLVRHAQASFGARDYDALSENGHAQARATGRALKASVPRVARVVGGTMRRHRETADACLAAMDSKVPYEADAGWDEYDHRAILCAFEPRYADHDAMVADFMEADHPARAFERTLSRALARWMSGEHDADYPESWRAFRARVDSAVGRLASAPDAEGVTLVFTSGGPIAAACHAVLDLPVSHGLRLARGLANASVTRLAWRARDGRYGLASFNEHTHFSGEDAGLLTFR